MQVLSKVDTLRKNQLANVLAEQSILASANNPFVVKLYYSFTSENHLYLVMEFVNGGDLFSLLQGVGRLDEAIARAYIAELCLALHYLHETLGVVHRDIKPDNVLIDAAGHVVLTDFGLSHFGVSENLAAAPEAEGGDHPPARTGVGSPPYMAPELLLGTGHGPAVDWWALGIVAYELLTGVTPFAGTTAEEVFSKVLACKVLWPDVSHEEISADARDLVHRLVNPHPQARLGAGGAREVMAHPWFSGVDWNSLRDRRRSEAPFVPQLDDVYDTSYFVERLRKGAGSANRGGSLHRSAQGRDGSTADASVAPAAESAAPAGDTSFGAFETFVHVGNLRYKTQVKLDELKSRLAEDYLSESGSLSTTPTHSPQLPRRVPP